MSAHGGFGVHPGFATWLAMCTGIHLCCRILSIVNLILNLGVARRVVLMVVMLICSTKIGVLLIWFSPAQNIFLFIYLYINTYIYIHIEMDKHDDATYTYIYFH